MLNFSTQNNVLFCLLKTAKIITVNYNNFITLYLYTPLRFIEDNFQNKIVTQRHTL